MSIKTEPLGIRARITGENGELSGIRLKIQHYLADENGDADPEMITVGKVESFALRPERIEFRKELIKQLFKEEYEWEMLKRIEEHVPG